MLTRQPPPVTIARVTGDAALTENLSQAARAAWRDGKGACADLVGEGRSFSAVVMRATWPNVV